MKLNDTTRQRTQSRYSSALLVGQENNNTANTVSCCVIMAPQWIQLNSLVLSLDCEGPERPAFPVTILFSAEVTMVTPLAK